MHDDEIDVDIALVQRLLSEELPKARCPSAANRRPGGTDNAIWRLGDDHVGRLPFIHWRRGPAARPVHAW